MNGKVEERKKDNFKAFCKDLRSGKDSFCYHLDLGENHYFVRCCTGGEGLSRVVYGVIRLEKKGNASGEFLYKRASDKDPMLDMLNKRAITEYAQRVMEMENCPTTYLVIFDLDNFKVVNDTFGHMFGDEVLVTVTDIIKKSVGKRGMIGRLGGDEILIVTKGVPDKAELRTILKDIRYTVENTYKGKLDGISLTCSMGAAAYPDHGDSYRKVMELADKMLYLAKDKGRNRYVIYTPELHRDLFLNPAAGLQVAGNLALTYDKTAIMRYMLEDFLIRRSSSNEVAFTQIGNAFKLSEILAVYDHSGIGFRWTPECIAHSDEDLKWITQDDDFFGRFDENDLYVIDGLYALTEKNPELEKKLKQRDVQSALFFRLKQKGIPDGFVMFAKKVQRQKWSEYEILALSTMAKIFELSIFTS